MIDFLARFKKNKIDFFFGEKSLPPEVVRIFFKISTFKVLGCSSNFFLHILNTP